MTESLERLFKRFLKLQERKWHLIYKIYYKSASRIDVCINLNKLKQLVLKEIIVARKIAAVTSKASTKTNDENLSGMLQQTAKVYNSLIEVFREEYRVLSSVRLRHLLQKNYHRNVSKMGESFHDMFCKETELSKKLDRVVKAYSDSFCIEGYNAKRKRAEKVRKVLEATRERVCMLLVSIGNAKRVNIARKALNRLFSRLQHTEMYGFVRHDVELVKSEVKQMLENPHENKLKHILACVYLFAPFTFDATGSLLLLRYATKYAMSKGRKVKSKLEEIRKKRRPRLKVFE